VNINPATCASAQSVPWEVSVTTNEEDCIKSGMRNPRDVSMISTAAEIEFGEKFKDLSSVISVL